MKNPQKTEKLKRDLLTPPVLAEKAPYLLKFAETGEEMETITRLRYRVFNEEQGKGLASSDTFGRDQDEFDPFCSHLFVFDREKNAIAGTYRILPGPVALHSGRGFYSEREFAFEGLSGIAEDAIETGRSCVAPEYRNGTVIALLWSGFSLIMARTGMRYLFGCASLEETSPEAGWLLNSYFEKEGKRHGEITATPREGFLLPPKNEEECNRFLEQKGLQFASLIPPLFKGYLRMGAKILGEPAFDPDFGSIDFPILLDVAKLPPSYRKHFQVKEVK